MLSAPEGKILFGKEHEWTVCKLYIYPKWDPFIEVILQVEIINNDFDKISEHYRLNDRDANTFALDFNSAEDCKVMCILNKIPVLELQKFFDRFIYIYVCGQLNKHGYGVDIEPIIRYFGGCCSSNIVFMHSNPVYYEIKHSPYNHYNGYYEHSIRTYAIMCDRAFYRRRDAIFAMYL